MRDERGALHLEVLHALEGRLRLRFERPVSTEKPFSAINGVLSCVYNPRLQTLLCQYDPRSISQDILLFRIGAIYARLVGTKLLHIKRLEEPGFSMPTSGVLALGCIALDGMLTAAASSLTNVSRWISTGATLAAVVEHGYHELHTRGSFDPEVMSVVYLLNSIGKTNALQASVLSWAVTFGRHLLPREPREQVYLVRVEKKNVTLTPVAGNESGGYFIGSMLRRGVEVFTRRGTPLAGI